MDGPMKGIRMVDEHLRGKKAFLPMMHEEDGREVPIVAEVEYGKASYTPVPGKRFGTFSQAEDEALRMNQDASIPSDVWWAIGESVKNTDV